MSGATLRGMVVGTSRAELFSKVQEAAEKFFGTKCVSVDLAEATTNLTGSVRTDFTASFTSEVHHRLEHHAYGPDKCRGCGRESWPHAPLNGGAS